MAMSREELFEKAKEKRKEKKEKEESNFGGSQFEDVVYTALSVNNDKVVRVIGNPMVARQNPTDPKLSIISMILGDNDKKFRCIWPDRSDDPNWILWKIYDKVLSYDWDRTNNVKKFHNVDSHPELFRRVAKNNSENQYEQGWKPSKVVQMNVIDRHDMEWHREEKHLKVLSKKASENGDRIWFEPGVPEYLYTKIWDDIVEYNGDWQNYDVVLRKLKESPWYSAFHSVDDLKKISDNVKEFIVEGDITEEELSWEGYDFDTLFPVTSYSKIKNRLGKFIKKVDLDFDTKYYEELESLVEVEEKEREKNPKTTKSVTKTKEVKSEEKEDDVDLDLEPEEAPEPEVKEKPKTRTRTKKATSDIPWDDLYSGEYNGTEYLGVKSLTDEEKSMIEEVNEDGSFKYVKTWKGNPVSLLKNPDTDFICPEEFHVDPISGEVFED